MATMNVKDAAGSTVAVEKPLTPGQALMAASRPVVLASDQTSIPVAATLAAETTKVIGTVRTASGGIASGSVASGAVASGAYAAGSLAAGAGVDGWDLTQGAIADAAVAAGATGSISAKLRAISRDIVANIVLAAGSAIIGKVGVDQTTPGTTNAVSLSHIGSTAVATGSGAMSAGVIRTALATDSPGIIATGTAGSASATVLTVQGVASMTPVATTQGVTATANGATASRVNAAGSTNATNLKASAGQIYTIDVFNVAAYNVFLKIYNKASSPTVGTDTPVMTIPIQAGGGYSKTWSMGYPLGTGISYAITKLQADSDTTAVTALDLTGNIIWI